jgi:hypothetical protein
MLDTFTIIELCRRSDVGIFAVPYRAGRPSRAVRIPDGAIVEAPTPDQRCEAPDHPPACFDVAIDGGPATIHHVNLGLIKAFLAYDGVFVLSTGEVASVYGAVAIPLG